MPLIREQKRGVAPSHYKPMAIHQSKQSSSWSTPEFTEKQKKYAIAFVVLALVVAGVVIAILAGKKVGVFGSSSSSNGGGGGVQGTGSCGAANYPGQPSSYTSLCTSTPSNQPYYTVDSPASFEQPYLGCGNYEMSVPETCYQGWLQPGTPGDGSYGTGIGAECSQFDPGTCVAPPDGVQYGIWDGQSGSSVWFLGEPATPYVLKWWIAAKSGTYSNCTVSSYNPNQQVLWMSGTTVWPTTWTQVTSAPTSVTESNGLFAVVVTCLPITNGAVVLFDDFTLTQA